jgi:hypothetical protein
VQRNEGNEDVTTTPVAETAAGVSLPRVGATTGPQARIPNANECPMRFLRARLLRRAQPVGWLTHAK